MNRNGREEESKKRGKEKARREGGEVRVGRG